MSKLLAALAAAAVALSVGAQETTKAEVTKVDKASLRVTLKHEGVKSLDMPPMTMAFRVSSPHLLDDLAAGNRVRFTAERIGGVYTVTSISKAP